MQCDGVKGALQPVRVSFLGKELRQLREGWSSGLAAAAAKVADSVELLNLEGVRTPLAGLCCPYLPPRPSPSTHTTWPPP